METRPGNYSDLAGKTAVVTGGSHGVGSGICRELGRQGSRVVVNGRGILCACAGGPGDPISIGELRLDAGRAGIDVNLTSAFLTLREFSTSHAVRRVNH
jgi:hypothetical protein